MPVLAVLRQQLVVAVHLDPVLAHHLDEGVVLGLRLLHPQDVVEQELVVTGPT